jgi:DNA-directed RNA polymerase subunit RPC12/RpoP
MDEFTEVSGLLDPSKKRFRPYYEDLGRAHDMIMRCQDCKRLVTYKSLEKHGCCPHCAHRKMVEVRTLSVWEWMKIRLGVIRFPDSEAFLKEFKGHA